ncbi:MAG: hypothetical protein JHD02_01245, partial [Thermoleophilaceae bacterium]|nr:hypothetical protein [Thermoleophilaceae bacterium]
IKENPAPEAYLVQINPRVTNALLHTMGSPIAHLEMETGKAILFEGGDGLPLEHFAVTFEGTVKKVEEKALPFAIGDEVMVHVVEPHMYEDDAAVAKLDHYIIAIKGALDRIGTRALVRITDVGRNVARAEIADDGPPKGARKKPAAAAANGKPSDGNDASTENGNDDQLESSGTRAPRRRGSRGGRGRSRAKTGTDGPGKEASDS